MARRKPEPIDEGMKAAPRARVPEPVAQISEVRQQVEDKRLKLANPDRSTLKGVMADTYQIARGHAGDIRSQILASCPYGDNSLELFLLSAYLGQGVPGAVTGLLQCEPHQYGDLFKHIANQLRRNSGMQGLPFEVVGRLGELCPFPLLNVAGGLKWLEENDPGEYAELRRGGMLGPGSVFNGRLMNARYFMVVADLTIADYLDSDRLRVASTLMRSIAAAGVHVLGVYHDASDMKQLRTEQFLSFAPNFFLGRF